MTDEQRRITQTRIDDFTLEVARLEERGPAPGVDPKLHQLQIDGMKSQIETMQRELEAGPPPQKVEDLGLSPARGITPDAGDTAEKWDAVRGLIDGKPGAEQFAKDAEVWAGPEATAMLTAPSAAVVAEFAKAFPDLAASAASIIAPDRLAELTAPQTTTDPNDPDAVRFTKEEIQPIVTSQELIDAGRRLAEGPNPPIRMPKVHKWADVKAGMNPETRARAEARAAETLDPKGVRVDDWDNPRVATPHLGRKPYVWDSGLPAGDVDVTIIVPNDELTTIREGEPESGGPDAFKAAGGIITRPIQFHAPLIDPPELMGPPDFIRKAIAKVMGQPEERLAVKPGVLERRPDPGTIKGHEPERVILDDVTEIKLELPKPVEFSLKDLTESVIKPNPRPLEQLRAVQRDLDAMHQVLDEHKASAQKYAEVGARRYRTDACFHAAVHLLAGAVMDVIGDTVDAAESDIRAPGVLSQLQAIQNMRHQVLEAIIKVLPAVEAIQQAVRPDDRLVIAGAADAINRGQVVKVADIVRQSDGTKRLVVFPCTD